MSEIWQGIVTNQLDSIPLGVRDALAPQGFVTTRDRAVCLSSLFVGKRFPLHASLVTGSRGVARLAPAGAVAHAGVVIHSLGRPRNCAAMAGIAVHRRTVQQLRLGNMVRHLRHGPAAGSLRGIAAVVARLASHGFDHRVIHRDGCMETNLRLVA